MTETITRELTDKEKKFLSKLKLSDKQREKIREVWQSEKESPKNIYTYLFLSFWLWHLVYFTSAICIMVLALLKPKVAIATNVLPLIYWTYYPLLNVFLFSIIALLIILNISYYLGLNCQKDSDPEKYLEDEKFYFKTHLELSFLSFWSGKQLSRILCTLLIVFPMMILLAFNGFIATSLVVLYGEILGFAARKVLKIMIQKALDNITNNQRMPFPKLRIIKFGS
ncbi:MAG: hypothetical protein NTX82_00165 [Candidatus Parcubacteria bacterium]|nr:hypothetical protein [Candidatus Parcubacteria bacterium]